VQQNWFEQPHKPTMTMRKTRLVYLSLTIIILLKDITLLAQTQATDEVRINPYSKRSTTIAPFDKYFILVLPVDSSLTEESFNQLAIYKTDKKGNLGTKIIDYDNDAILKYGNLFDTSQYKGFKSLRVFINQQVAPNTRMQFFLFHGINQKVYKKLDEINFLLLNGNESRASTLYLALAKEQFKPTDGTGKRWPPFKLGDKDAAYDDKQPPYVKFYDDDLKLNYQLLNKTATDINDGLIKLRDELAKNKISVEVVTKCNCAGDLIGLETSPLLTDLTIPLYNIIYHTDETKELLSSGLISLVDAVYGKPLNFSEIEGRKNNLLKTENGLKVLTSFLKGSSLGASIDNPRRTSLLELLNTLCQNIEDRMEVLATAAKTIRKALFTRGSLFAVDKSISGSAPLSQDIKTNSGNYIIPDIGLANIISVIDHQYKYIPRPYFGVNISFRAINKSQPFGDIQKRTFWHYTSLVVGLTTFSLSREGTADLFNGMSLVAGVGIRTSRAFRITPGILLYQASSANPLKANRYVIAPTLNASLDLDVASWFSSLSGKVFK